MLDREELRDILIDLVERKQHATGGELAMINRQIHGLRTTTEEWTNQFLETLDEWNCASDYHPPPAQAPEGLLIRLSRK